MTRSMRCSARVHSVKGGAGIFGFEALVGFAHVFETVLDGLRRGSLTATPETLDVLLSASDVLSDLVQMSRAGEAVRAGLWRRMPCGSLNTSSNKTSGRGAEDDDSPAPADFDGIDFTPVPRRSRRCPPDAMCRLSARSFAITFRPKPEMLKKANEPLYILRNLRKFGALDLVAQIGRPAAHWRISSRIVPIFGGPARCKLRRRGRRSTKSSNSLSTIAISRSLRRIPPRMPAACRKWPSPPAPAIAGAKQSPLAPPMRSRTRIRTRRRRGRSQRRRRTGAASPVSDRQAGRDDDPHRTRKN